MQICKNLFFWVFFTFCQTYHLTAQTIGLDPTFANNGRFFYNETGTREEGSAVLEQPDGKVIIIGVTDYDPDEGNNSRIIVIRLNSNGSFDNLFGTNGKVYIDTPNSSDQSSNAVLQNDGKIVICGIISTDNLENDISVKMYPNPVQDELIIEVESADDRINHIAFFDLTGRIVWQDNNKDSFDETTVSYSMSKLVPGSYYVVITMNKGRKTLPLLKI